MEKELEKQILNFYGYSRPIWRYLGRINKTYGMHVGFYEKGIKNFIEASLNMNSYVGRLLELKKDVSMNILDAGCGVGGTSIHLAKMYPNINFTGITIVPEQLELAKKYAMGKQIKNVEFALDDFNNTTFSDNYFDGIFALESILHSDNKEDLVKEMYRILKPGGRLVVINVFRNDKPMKHFMEKIYDSHLNAQGAPDIITVKVFESYLKSNGFLNIKINNISKNVNNRGLENFIFSAPFFVYFIIKNFFIFKKYKQTHDVDYLSRLIVVGALFGLQNIVTYYAITADKKYSNNTFQ